MSCVQLSFLPNVNEVQKPKGYKGLHAFHKYWGKKPLEPLAFLIDKLTVPGALIVDPFMGSCASGVEALRLGRRFVGMDLNPLALRLGTVLISPPSLSDVREAFDEIEKRAKPLVQESYVSLSDESPITHYLWDSSKLIQMWVSNRSRTKRREHSPTDSDIALFQKFEGYVPKQIRQPHFFSNSRINANPHLTLNDLFTGRALRNLEILLDVISVLPPSQQLPMQLSATAASGQMSKMVFAITRRGKTSGALNQKIKIEVGSWVIGFWRPGLHFEINVWNCFESRVRKLVSAVGKLEKRSPPPKLGRISDTINSLATCSLINADALAALTEFPDGSVDLILTDPPHGDRIPYLELSELWNSILGLEANFSDEIVVSNARERGKTKDTYNAKMKQFLELAARKIKPSGAIAILFNARDIASWEFLVVNDQMIVDNRTLRYMGHFPMEYSAGSVVQDSRAGGLKNDFALLFAFSDTSRYESLRSLSNWSTEMPSESGISKCR